MKEKMTYLLFGNEAIGVYKMSLKLLLSSTHLSYKVGEYNDVKKFITETEKWDGFLEIEKDDYLVLKKHKLKSPLYKVDDSVKEQKKFSIFNFFKW